MIEVKGPVQITTLYGTIRITVEDTSGKIIVETFQRDGKARYELDRVVGDGKLKEKSP